MSPVLAPSPLRPVARHDAALDRRVREAFTAFVRNAGFPCLAAKAMLHHGGDEVRVYGALGSAAASAALARDLARFPRQDSTAGMRFRAFVAIFTGRPPASEAAFERRLWAQLQRLHDADPVEDWDPAVSDDPRDPRFSFSFGGTAFFVVGLHPRSSRHARRFRYPALVFNPHAQFEQLRREGRFEPLRDRIRARDVALQGSPNPTLSEFGERSEAEQYSGRDTTAAPWRCPFHRRDSEDGS